MRKAANKGGSRPVKEVDWELVDKLLLAGCHGTEIAPHFDMHHETFYRKVEEKFGIGFTAYSLQKKQKGDSILRSKQYENALKGNTTMQIWLGKNRLSQKETDLVVPLPPNDSHLNQDLEIVRLKGQLQLVEEKLREFESKANPIIQPSNETI